MHDLVDRRAHSMHLYRDVRNVNILNRGEKVVDSVNPLAEEAIDVGVVPFGHAQKLDARDRAEYI